MDIAGLSKKMLELGEDGAVGTEFTVACMLPDGSIYSIEDVKLEEETGTVWFMVEDY